MATAASRDGQGIKIYEYDQIVQLA